MTFVNKFLGGMLLALVLAGAAVAATVDINSADAKTLETLNGIGPAKAQAIVEYRNANGPFKTVEDLGKVDGIGSKILEANRENMTVGRMTPAAEKAKATKN